MVDFNSKLLNTYQEAKIDPLELYETLDRASDKGSFRVAYKPSNSTRYDRKTTYRPRKNVDRTAYAAVFN